MQCVVNYWPVNSTPAIEFEFFSYQDFMSKTDRAHMEGIVVAKSVDGEIVGKDGRARREIREVGGISASGSFSSAVRNLL